MDKTIILPLVKERLGIRHTQRDTYLNAIIDGVVKELEDEKGITLVAGDYRHMMFIVDFVAYRFEDPKAAMPRNLQFRLHNLMIHNGGDANV